MPGGAGDMKEQGSLLGCAGRGEVGSSKYSVAFLPFNSEAALLPLHICF